MGVSGSVDLPSGGAPMPDPQRVATVRYAIVDEPETCAAFAEPARAALADLNDRALAETRTSDLGECAILLAHVRDRIGALNPARLEPRQGFAGLFDSRGKRLKALRVAFQSAASGIGDAAADIGDRGGAIARKGTTLDALWAETRDAIAELDAHIAAARAWLANPDTATVTEPDPGPQTLLLGVDDPSADAVVDDPADPAPVTALPHPLQTRLSILKALRAVAIARLPLLRAAQNADCRAPSSLKSVCDGIEAWRAEWQDALGLAGRKPRKIRPDRDRLNQANTVLLDQITTADREIDAAQARRSELDARVTTAAPARLAA